MGNYLSLHHLKLNRQWVRPLNSGQPPSFLGSFSRNVLHVCMCLFGACSTFADSVPLEREFKYAVVVFKVEGQISCNEISSGYVSLGYSGRNLCEFAGIEKLTSEMNSSVSSEKFLILDVLKGDLARGMVIRAEYASTWIPDITRVGEYSLIFFDEISLSDKKFSYSGCNNFESNYLKENGLLLANLNYERALKEIFNKKLSICWR